MAFGPHIRILAVVGVFFAMTAALPVAAAPLDKEACDKLQTEKQSLTVMGVEKDMAKGAEWAKANMKPAQLDLVKRFITVDEQIKFRCHTAIIEARAEARAARIKAAKAAKAAKHAKATQASTDGDKAQQPAAKAQAAGATQAKPVQAKAVQNKAAAGADEPDDNEQD